MSWLTEMFHPTNPADKAMPYLDQLPDELKQYFQDYMNWGKSAYGTMNPVLSQMTTDPTGYLNKIMGAYEPSRSYQLQKDEMTKSAGNTAAAGGMRGSLGDITNEARITDTLMGNDMQNWLRNVMGLQDTGLQGMGHIFDTGFNANQAYAGDLGNIRGTQAQLAFQGQREANADKGDLFKGLLGALSSIAGGVLGGPLGGAIGSGIGSMFTPKYDYGSPSGKTSFPDFNTPPGGWM